MMVLKSAKNKWLFDFRENSTEKQQDVRGKPHLSPLKKMQWNCIDLLEQQDRRNKYYFCKKEKKKFSSLVNHAIMNRILSRNSKMQFGKLSTNNEEFSPFIFVPNSKIRVEPNQEFRIFPPLRFYVKSILVILKPKTAIFSI